MSNIGLLVPDTLVEIMDRLPPDINQKFTFAQVSRYWRDVSLGNHLFWSSFTCGPSKADCFRIPIVLERSGRAMLHPRFQFTDGHTPTWQGDAMAALVPHVARIETLEAEFWVYSNYSLPPRTVEALLNSNLEFPALQTLRLQGPEYGHRPLVQLTAPQLRTLDVELFDSGNWASLFSSSLETIRLYHTGREISLQPLLDIFDRCPRAWRVVYDAYTWNSNYEDVFFEAFTRRQPLAPALRELELRTDDADLSRIIKAGFSDVVLPTLTACLYGSEMDVLTEALLPGVGPLVVFELDHGMQQVELRDDVGHIRRLQCWNDDSSFEVDYTWEHLCVHYDLHKTVRELRIAHWNEYAEIFERYPPQLPDGITLIYTGAAHSYMASSLSTGEEEEDNKYVTKTMRIPGLARLEFSGEYPLILKSVLRILPLVEPPAGRKVEVCIRNMKLLTTETGIDPFGVFQRAFSGDCWAICNRCISHCVH
ncbi:hypothetical protein B0H14DRAFT_1032395 [Mycena olivaceomarginata]|nr:hypothetical protein B0H14DRAFT_1032395 [Mycena olivaceomarginata]